MKRINNISYSRGKRIKIRLAQFTDPAGKLEVGAPYNGNEDDYTVIPNLDTARNNSSAIPADTVFEMGERGTLLAVADGMGGMNAGEIASHIAIQIVDRCFKENDIPLEVAQVARSRERYLEDVIIKADTAIKYDAKQNPEHEGMGSTIILAWLVGNEITVSWCGDSRAYRYNPTTGNDIEMLSKDHSYVQELVDKGLLTYEATFNHPQNNIVTRSLGDPDHVAEPETKTFPIYKSDIILLCSDGLSGVLFDKKAEFDGKLLSEKNIQDTIKNNHNSMRGCCDALFKAASESGWYDNVTAILCEVTESDKISKPIAAKPTPNPIKKTTLIIGLIIAFILGFASCFVVFKYTKLLTDRITDVTMDDSAGQQTAGQQTAGQQTAGQQTAGQQAAGQQAAGQQTAGQQDAEPKVQGEPKDTDRGENSLTPAPSGGIVF